MDSWLWLSKGHVVHSYHSCCLYARRGGVEVAGWNFNRKTQVQFPAYPHRVWALWWQGGKRRIWTSRCPCWGRLGTLKTPSCPWRGFPAAGQNLETGHLSRHYIYVAEISLNVTLNHNQQQQQQLPVAFINVQIEDLQLRIAVAAPPNSQIIMKSNSGDILQCIIFLMPISCDGSIASGASAC